MNKPAIKPHIVSAETIECDDEDLAVGQWYWTQGDDDDERCLRCIVHLGTNYAELKSVYGSSIRVHFDEFLLRCQRCYDYEHVIQHEIDQRRGKLSELMGEVQRIMGSLAGQGSSNALVVLRDAPNLKHLKSALVKAKDKQLPELFKQIEHTSENLGRWMAARTIPLKGQAGSLRDHIATIDEQIFGVELYTGLVENVVQISKGKPAPASEKLHLMQRMHFMDEECLLDYQAGGMRFESLSRFDKWLKKKKNRDRLLPFPRCMIAFRVRRKMDRHYLGMISMFEPDPDEQTFLYIRNGTNLYRLVTSIKFEEKLFPNLDHRQLEEGKLWVKERFSEYIVIPDRRYQQLCEEYDRKLRAWKKKIKKTPKKDRWHHDCPNDPRKRYFPYNQDSVYYDDITEHLNKETKKHNKIALVLQGLFDRSAVLHPHPPVKLWENLEEHVKLVYDTDRAITVGEAPDFEAYRKRLNASLKKGCITAGQQKQWLRHEADKEHERVSWRGYSFNREYFKPMGNPGPGRLAVVTKVSRDKTKASYRWMRERRSWNWKLDDTPVPATFTAEVSGLLNVNAYKPGDFKQFFEDPRTRADYLKWAPLLLAAEDYHAGKAKVGSDGD